MQIEQNSVAKQSKQILIFPLFKIKTFCEFKITAN